VNYATQDYLGLGHSNMPPSSHVVRFRTPTTMASPGRVISRRLDGIMTELVRFVT
jgi:hypothetical protein